MPDHFQDEKYAQVKQYCINATKCCRTNIIPTPEEREKDLKMTVSLSPGFFTGSNETVCRLPGFRLVEVMVNVHAGKGGGTVRN